MSSSKPTSSIEQMKHFSQMESNYAFGFINEKNSPWKKELSSKEGQEFIKTVNFVNAIFDPAKNEEAANVLSSLRDKDFNDVTLTQEDKTAAVKTTANAFLKIYGLKSITTVPIIAGEADKKALLDVVIKRFKEFADEMVVKGAEPFEDEPSQNSSEDGSRPLFPHRSDPSSPEKKAEDVVTLRKAVTVLQKTANGYIPSTKWNTVLKVMDYLPLISIISGIVHIILASININRITSDDTLDADTKKVLLRNNKEALARGFGGLLSIGFVFIPIDIYKTATVAESEAPKLTDHQIYTRYKHLSEKIEEIAADPNKIFELRQSFKTSS